MLRPLNVAIPANVPVPVRLDLSPESVSPPGLLPSATVMFGRPPGNEVTRFPNASSTVTRTAGVMMLPATELLGCTENTSCVAVPAVMLNAVLVALPAPAVRLARLAKVAPPAAAATVAVRAAGPPPGFVPLAPVISPGTAVAVFPAASCAVPGAAGVIAAPAGVVVGWTLNTSAVAV